MLKTESVEKRRSRPDIFNDILKIVVKGARKTRIVYGANLNFKLLREYLDDMERQGLLAIEEDGKIVATEKGKEYLIYYQGLRNFGVTGRCSLLSVNESMG